MGKNTKVAVRSHSQEREWLVKLGKGNIFEGVQNLIQQEKREQWGKNKYFTPKSGKSKTSSKR